MRARTRTRSELDESTSWSSTSGAGWLTIRTASTTTLYARLAERFDDEQIVPLTAFGAIMIATNVFNDALRVDLDGYLSRTRAAR